MASQNDFYKFFSDLQDQNSTEETVVKRVMVQDDSGDGFIGGEGQHERTDPDGGIYKVTETRLIRTCIGCVVTTDPNETRYPYYAGKCSWGHDVCNLHLQKCDEPGCDKMVCPREAYEYRQGQYKCPEHYRLWTVIRIIKFFLSPFVKFPD